MPTASIDLKPFIRDIPDFPKKGVIFKDITPLLSDASAFRLAVEGLARAGREAGVTKVVAVESRGFIFGAPVAQLLGVGLVPVRKKGKLPFKTRSASYALEYGTDTLEMHVDALQAGDRALIVDDVLATGGTAQTVAELVAETGAHVVALSFLIELSFLKGRDRLRKWPVTSLLTY